MTRRFGAHTRPVPARPGSRRPPAAPRGAVAPLLPGGSPVGGPSPAVDGGALLEEPLTLFDGDRCPICAGPVDRAATGRPPTYCSHACRQKAFRGVTKPEVAPTSIASVPPAAPARLPTSPAALVAIAAGIPTPVDHYGPARAYAEVRDGGYGVVFGLDGGRVNEPVGPVFRRPRQAIALADLLDGRLVAA